MTLEEFEAKRQEIMYASDTTIYDVRSPISDAQGTQYVLTQREYRSTTLGSYFEEHSYAGGSTDFRLATTVDYLVIDGVRTDRPTA